MAGRIVDAVGGLIGSAGNGLGDGEPFDQGDAFDPEPVEADDTDEQTPEADAEHPGDVEDVEDTVEPEPEPAAEPAGPPPPPGAAPVGVPPPPGAAPVDAPAPADAPAAGGSAPPADETKTPCEIAADQLPQAGQ